MSSSDRSGVFVSFEGIDGCGKSTLLAQLSAWLNAAGVPHLQTREPGGTVLGEALRSMLLDSSFSGMHPWAEALMYAAARAQHVSEVILPTLKRGHWVLTDRYADATMAYQGYGRGLDIRRLDEIHRWTTGDLRPDVSVLLDCSVATAIERRHRRQDQPDRLELLDTAFHERVRSGYLALAASERGRFLVLDADRSIEAVTEDFLNHLKQRLGLRG
jgi:dTMP kinase